jgi:hypothetical protein
MLRRKKKTTEFAELIHGVSQRKSKNRLKNPVFFLRYHGLPLFLLLRVTPCLLNSVLLRGFFHYIILRKVSY